MHIHTHIIVKHAEECAWQACLMSANQTK